MVSGGGRQRQAPTIGMRQIQLPRMQHQGARRTSRDGLRPAIFRIAEDRAVHQRAMDAKLMGASRKGCSASQAESLPARAIVR